MSCPDDDLEGLPQQLGRVQSALNWFDRDHVAERERLLAALANAPQEVPLPWTRRIRRKVKEIVTMPRTWIASAAAAAILAALLFLGGGPGGPPLLADAVKALRDIKSYRCRLTEESNDGKKEPTTFKWYWAAPESYRMDGYDKDKLISVELAPRGKPGLEIDHRAKTYVRTGPHKGEASPVEVLNKLPGYAGQADRQLEPRAISGVKAPGFEIATEKIDPDILSGTLRLWMDPRTKLPLRIEFVLDEGRMVFDEFEWNLPAESWFKVEPPAGYKDATPAPYDVEEITGFITFGFKTYLKYCGRYPQHTKIYGDVTSIELNRNARLPDRSLPKDRALDNIYSECMKASRGFGWINELQRHDAGAIYHGKNVDPQDKNKVLFRWTLPDGRFRVIYADLRVEDVSARRLKKLETQ
jgi:outer membrane lipoprotein-sorting protein